MDKQNSNKILHFLIYWSTEWEMIDRENDLNSQYAQSIAGTVALRAIPSTVDAGFDLFDGMLNL